MHFSTLCTGKFLTVKLYDSSQKQIPLKNDLKDSSYKFLICEWTLINQGNSQFGEQK